MRLLFLLLCALSGALSSEVDLSSLRDGTFTPYMALIGKNIPTYAAMITNYVKEDFPVNGSQELTEELAAALEELKEVTLYQEPTLGRSDRSPECIGCTVGMPVLRWLINNRGKSYEDLRGIIVVVCIGIMTSLGQNGRIICPGILDNFVPPIFQIAKDTENQLWSIQTCRFLNYCPPKNIEAPPYGHYELSPFAVSPAQAPAAVTGRTRQRRETSEVYRILQMTDIHFDYAYAQYSATECKFHVCCRRNYLGSGRAGKWGDYNCNIPPRTMKRIVEKAKELKPDLVFCTGDIPPHHLWYETQERQTNAHNTLAQELREAFPDTPVLPAIGNHDPFPSNMYYAPNNNTKLLFETLLDNYPSLQEDFIKETVRVGGYYEKQLPGLPGVRLIHYNSNYGYTDNWFNLLSHFEHTDYLKMRHFVEDRLAAARRDKVKVILMAHHPNGGGVIAYDEWVTQTCLAFSDVIALHVVGHTHKDSLALYKSRDDTWARTMQFVAPTAGTEKRHNPSLRVYIMDKHTHELLDIEQYRMDMEAAKTLSVLSEPPIELHHRASEEYDLEDMSPVSWHKLVVKMTEDVDTLNKFLDNKLTGVQVQPKKCEAGDQACIRSTLCRLVSTTLPDTMRCMRDGVPIPSVPLN